MVEDFVDARLAALSGLFDDATLLGSSPSVPDAMAAFRGHLIGDRSWLVRRLLVRAGQASEVLANLEDDDALPLGVVLDRAEGGSLGESLAADLVAISPLVRDPRVRVESLQVTLDGRDPDAEVAALMAGLQGARIGDGVVVSVEVALTGRSAGQVVRHLAALAAVRRAGGADATRVEAIVRLDGDSAGDIPDDLDVAGVLLACTRERVPLNVATGLSSPTRMADPDHGGDVHGLLNVLAAGCAAHQGGALEAIKAQLAWPAESFKLGSGALVVDTEVIEGPAVSAVRTDLLRGVAIPDLLAVLTQLAQMGVVTPTGGPA